MPAVSATVDINAPIALTYRYLRMSVLTGWTVRRQAANEIVETAMALAALSWTSESQGTPPPALPASEAIHAHGARPGP